MPLSPKDLQEIRIFIIGILTPNTKIPQSQSLIRYNTAVASKKEAKLEKIETIINTEIGKTFVAFLRAEVFQINQGESMTFEQNWSILQDLKLNFSEFLSDEHISQKILSNQIALSQLLTIAIISQNKAICIILTKKIENATDSKGLVDPNTKTDYDANGTNSTPRTFLKLAADVEGSIAYVIQDLLQQAGAKQTQEIYQAVPQTVSQPAHTATTIYYVKSEEERAKANSGQDFFAYTINNPAADQKPKKVEALQQNANAEIRLVGDKEITSPTKPIAAQNSNLPKQHLHPLLEALANLNATKALGEISHGNIPDTIPQNYQEIFGNCSNIAFMALYFYCKSLTVQGSDESMAKVFVELLTKNQNYKNAQNLLKQNNTLLHEIAANTSQPKAFHIFAYNLLSIGADQKLLNANYQTSLYLACSNTNINPWIIRLLALYGGDIITEVKTIKQSDAKVSTVAQRIHDSHIAFTKILLLLSTIDSVTSVSAETFDQITSAVMNSAPLLSFIAGKDPYQNIRATHAADIAYLQYIQKSITPEIKSAFDLDDPMFSLHLYATLKPYLAVTASSINNNTPLSLRFLIKVIQVTKPEFLISLHELKNSSFASLTNLTHISTQIIKPLEQQDQELLASKSSTILPIDIAVQLLKKVLQSTTEYDGTVSTIYINFCINFCTEIAGNAKAGKAIFRQTVDKLFVGKIGYEDVDWEGVKKRNFDYCGPEPLRYNVIKSLLTNYKNLELEKCACFVNAEPVHGMLFKKVINAFAALPKETNYDPFMDLSIYDIEGEYIFYYLQDATGCTKYLNEIFTDKIKYDTKKEIFECKDSISSYEKYLLAILRSVVVSSTEIFPNITCFIKAKTEAIAARAKSQPQPDSTSQQELISAAPTQTFMRPIDSQTQSPNKETPNALQPKPSGR